MPEAVAVGVIGTSWWAELMYLPSLTGYPKARLAAICGRDQEHAAEVAGKYGIPQVFTDYREMIRTANLDAVVVSTPDDLHHPMTMAAIEAGLHVLCEKPLAMTAPLAKEMLERAEAKGVKHMVLFTNRWLPPFRYVHELVQSGYIGRPYHAQFSFVSHYGTEYMWRLDGRRANGVLGDLGAHMIDLSRWYLGEVVGVSARLNTFMTRRGAEDRVTEPANDAASLLLGFDSGAQATVQVSAVALMADRSPEIELKLYGEAGTIELEFGYEGPKAGGTVRGARHGEGGFQTFPEPDALWGDSRSNPISLFYKESIGPRAFIDAIIEDRPTVPNFYDGLKAQEVIDAALELAGGKSNRETLPIKP
jgi:predicted dehydrogenase